ncbi:hypothetical protein TNCV_1589031 [Trichonephila clavipes]|uniref:Uncharacterized protein n=1 Tax=Trichonephila clavipes TaxID=2585209 RepID=A0A8X6RLF9_TRICX|nr:hypothetical protein TNCV_1589031 [Trichonephila clavipes]
MRVYGGRSRPFHGRWSSDVASRYIVLNSQFFGEYNRRKLLTIEIIRIIILLRISRERYVAPIVTKALGQLAHALRRPWVY